MHGLKNVRIRRTDPLSRVGWDQLESLLAIYYRGRGYRVDHVGTGASSSRFDGGIDLKLYKDDEYIVVQCKHWNAKQVPHNDVHQLLGIMVNEGATGAILVSSGEFTPYARESAARQGHVQLIDGDALREMIGPLPESEAADADVRSRARLITAHVGDRLLSAAEDRIRGDVRRNPRPRKLARTAKSLFLLKVVLPVAVAAVIALMMFSAIKTVINGLQPASAAPVTQVQQLPAPTAEASQGVTTMPSSGAVQHDPGSDPCNEVIDWQSGTYIDHCAQGKPSSGPSAAEQRELKRRADEAIKVLEASTPEM